MILEENVFIDTCLHLSCKLSSSWLRLMGLYLWEKIVLLQGKYDLCIILLLLGVLAQVSLSRICVTCLRKSLGPTTLVLWYSGKPGLLLFRGLTPLPPVCYPGNYAPML